MSVHTLVQACFEKKWQYCLDEIKPEDLAQARNLMTEICQEALEELSSTIPDRTVMAVKQAFKQYGGRISELFIGKFPFHKVSPALSKTLIQSPHLDPLPEMFKSRIHSKSTEFPFELQILAGQLPLDELSDLINAFFIAALYSEEDQLLYTRCFHLSLKLIFNEHYAIPNLMKAKEKDLNEGIRLCLENSNYSGIIPPSEIGELILKTSIFHEQIEFPSQTIDSENEMDQIPFWQSMAMIENLEPPLPLQPNLPNRAPIPIETLKFSTFLSDEDRESLYLDYMKKVGCDCELISNSGSIMVHASVVHHRSTLLETATKNPSLLFKDYSNLAVRGFADSLYLGVEGFKEKYREKAIPIFEFLRFAHQYDQPIMYQGSRELICETATPEDAEKVREVNMICQNYFLSQLYKRLTSSESR